jgi:aspartate carbamoyltransferase regulatory subunit
MLNLKSNQITTRTHSNRDLIKVKGQSITKLDVSKIKVYQNEIAMESFDSNEIAKDMSSFRMNAIKMLTVNPGS